MRRLFGTDGMRGRVGDEPVTPETVLKLGWAAGRVLGGENGGKVIIGKDTRVSGYMLESALEAGLSAAGTDISLLGPMPTPGIAYLTRTARARAGIVISASHNPYDDNGIKFFSPDGVKLPDDVEREIERVMDEPMRIVASSRLGKAERFADAAGRYIEFCKSTVPPKVSLKGLAVVVDCANGAAYHVAPDVFEELGADVTALGIQPDGFNINRDCGSLHTASLREAVLRRGADLGIALDGDGDRVILVDAQGECVDGDQILYILGTWRQTHGAIEGGVVGTLMTNYGLEQAFARHDIPFRRAPVGDRYVLSCLQEEGWMLGGESSGHIICLDKSTTGDGIIGALQVIHAMLDTGRSLHELKAGMTVLPQTLINVRLQSPARGDGYEAIGDCGTVRDAVRAAEAELASNGRVLVRRSGTEPVIRVMVEGADAAQIGRIGRAIADAVESAATELA